MPRLLTRGAAPLIALALLLAACGGDDDGETTTDDTTAEDTATDDSNDAGGDDADDGAADDTADDGDADDAAADEEGEDTAEQDTGDEDTAAAVTILGLEITSIDFDTSEVTITNNGDAAVDIDGYSMCNFPDYAEISGVGAIEPGASVTIPSTVGISPLAGELGLYSTTSFSDPTAIQAYVEWGSADHERASVAIEAGIYDGTLATVEGNVLTNG